MRLDLKKRLPVAVIIDPEHANPKAIAGYFRQIAARLTAESVAMRIVIRFSTLEGGLSYPTALPRVALDFDPHDGKPVAIVGDRRAKFDVGHCWIPEHPVPLVFPCALVADPTGDGRFRVRETKLGAWARRVQEVFGKEGGKA